jgi:hypothetical protein
MFDVTDSREDSAVTRTEAKPAIASVNEPFSKSRDGPREIVRAVMQERLEAEVQDIGNLHLVTVRAKPADLARLETVLAETVGQCAANVTPACPLLDILGTEHGA